MVAQAKVLYGKREQELGADPMRQLERQVVLSVLDQKWREHLYEMDYLKDGIGLRGMGQRDPLVEYQREGFQMYNSMIDAIKEESVQLLYNVDLEQVAESTRARAQAKQEQENGADEDEDIDYQAPSDPDAVDEDSDVAAAAQETDGARTGSSDEAGDGGVGPEPTRPRRVSEAVGGREKKTRRRGTCCREEKECLAGGKGTCGPVVSG
ncbi:hypothetical protein CRD60_08310, partial [Bifidobacterium aemilianum]